MSVKFDFEVARGTNYSFLITLLVGSLWVAFGFGQDNLNKAASLVERIRGVNPCYVEILSFQSGFQPPSLDF